MTAPAPFQPLETAEVSAILDRTAGLLQAFHSSDLALQRALSTIAAKACSGGDIVDLQHVDLITQTHADLAALLKELAALLSGKPIGRHQLKSVLVLRSLQEALIEPDSNLQKVEPGELSLF